MRHWLRLRLRLCVIHASYNILLSHCRQYSCQKRVVFYCVHVFIVIFFRAREVKFKVRNGKKTKMENRRKNNTKQRNWITHQMINCFNRNQLFQSRKYFFCLKKLEEHKRIERRNFYVVVVFVVIVVAVICGFLVSLKTDDKTVSMNRKWTITLFFSIIYDIDSLSTAFAKRLSPISIFSTVCICVSVCVCDDA